MANINSNKIKLINLPEKYDLVVGDTFELFYKGIMLCKNPYAYNILVNCSTGKAWSRKFEVTPANAGEYPLGITVSDDFGNIIDKASTTLVVKDKMKSPSDIMNVLCVGDSLTFGGVWVDELHRRLTKTDSVTSANHTAPMGDGLSNIKFVGKQTAIGGAGYEAFGGWRFTHYLSTDSTTSNYWLSCTHSKTDGDQESIYDDDNGVKWQLETIEEERLKFKKYSGSGIMQPNGVLRHVIGGVDDGTVTYENATLEKGNPFVYDGKIDFAAYCADIGVDGIDVCYILLGWNSVAVAKDVYKSETKQFIEHLLSFNPDMKIVLIGLQIPSLDGCANNYGASGVYSEWRTLQEFVFGLDELYKEIADEYHENVTSINLSGQFDTEYNMQSMEMPVNTRNPATAKVGSNGVHPAIFGYYQIADAVYRHFNNNNQA